MDDEEIRSSAEQERDEELAKELRRLHPLMQRQRRAATMRPDAGFKRALLAQLTAPSQPAPAQSAGIWRTLVALLVPATPRLSLRGHGRQLASYIADDVTISLTVQPADAPTGGLISLYGEVDHPGGDQDESAGATVEALRGEAVVAATTVDDLGTFILPPLPPRVYALRLRFSNRREVIIPPAGYEAEGEVSLE